MYALWQSALLLGLSSTLLLRFFDPLVPESAERTPPVCVAFYDWKHDISFWFDEKMHAQQGPVPTGYPDYWQHVQTSLWEIDGLGLGEEEHLAFVDAHAEMEGDSIVEAEHMLAGDLTRSLGKRLRHMDFQEGYAVNHETTPCFSPPGGPGQGPS